MDDNAYKVVMVGSTFVGKTTIVVQEACNIFSTDYIATVGSQFQNVQIEVENERISLNIWDTAGQEQYRSLAPMYYRSAHMAIIVYSITEPKTFEDAKQWYNEIRNNCDEMPKIYFVGNKIDLENDRKIERADGSALASSYDASFIETSAKTGENINDLFTDVAVKLYTEYGKSSPMSQSKSLKAKSKDKGCCK